MPRICLFLTVLAACAATPGRYVERFVEATGGLEALQSIQTAHLESKGTAAGMEFTTVQHLRRPWDWRWDLNSPMGTMSMWVLGPKQEAYASAMGNTWAVEGDSRASTLTHARSSWLTLLPDRLLDTDITLEMADPVEIDGRRHKAVTARFAGGEPITYVFDTKTRLVRRILFRLWDDESLVWAQAVADIWDYREVGGIQVAHRMRMDWDGRMVIDEEVTAVRWNKIPEEQLLAAPEAAPPPEVQVRRVDGAHCVLHLFLGPPDQVGDALARMMAWIGSNGGQIAGAVAMAYKKPMNYADMAACETIIQVPVKMEKAPRSDEFKVGNRKPFLLAYVRYEGNLAAAPHQWGFVHNWCKNNGYLRTGARRMEFHAAPDEAGNAVVEVGFPVRKLKDWR